MAGRQVKILARIRPPIGTEFQDEGLKICSDGVKSSIQVENTKDASRVSSFP